MKKIDSLLRKAKSVTGQWKPFQYTLKGVEGSYVVSRRLWNGVPGSLSPQAKERHGVNTYSEWRYDSKSEAESAIHEDIRNFEQAHGCKLEPIIWDLCPPTKEELKERWLKGERIGWEIDADKAGMSLEAYIRKTFGEHESMAEETIRSCEDIIQWRKEYGIDGETTVALINSERSPGSID